jgi:hypothetical protein
LGHASLSGNKEQTPRRGGKVRGFHGIFQFFIHNGLCIRHVWRLGAATISLPVMLMQTNQTGA